MAGEKWGRKIQFGFETAPGAFVAPTNMWRGGDWTGFKEENDVVHVAENVGMAAPTDRTYIGRKGGTWSMDSHPATFEQTPVVLSCGLSGVKTGSAVGSGYLYTYYIPSASVNTIYTQTMKAGNNFEVRRMSYMFAETITLTGVPNEAVMLSADWRGQEVLAETTFASSIDVPDVKTILAGKGSLYANAASATFGSSRVSQTLYDWEVTINTGRKAKYLTDSGSLVFSYVYLDKNDFSVEGSFTYEHNATALNEMKAWRNQETRNLRLRIEGDALDTPGDGDEAAYTHELLQLDLTGRYTDFEALSDQDGNDTVACTLQAGWNSSASNFCSASVVNTISNLAA